LDERVREFHLKLVIGVHHGHRFEHLLGTDVTEDIEKVRPETRTHPIEIAGQD
jgi:hypothetical protein